MGRGIQQGAIRFLLASAAALQASASFAAEPYSIDRYLNALDQARVETLDQAIAELPVEIRENFTLVYQGAGLRETSMEKPAALLFGLDGRFVVTFNSKDQATGNTIEILQFVEGKDRFELFELEFPLRRDEQNKIVRPATNPAKCVECHQADPRPIWGPYPSRRNQVTWPGVYGSAEDVLSKKEKKGLEEFWATTGQGERFRHLRAPEGSPHTPYAPNFRGELLFRPNTRYTSLALRLTARSLARKLISSPNYGSLKYDLLFTFMNCGARQRFWLRNGEPDPLEGLIQQLGVTPLDFALTKKEIVLPLGRFTDGTGEYAMRSLVGNLILKDIALGDPELAAYQKDLSLAEFPLDNERDRLFESYGDAIARLPVDLDADTGTWQPKKACQVLRDRRIIP